MSICKSAWMPDACQFFVSVPDCFPVLLLTSLSLSLFLYVPLLMSVRMLSVCLSLCLFSCLYLHLICCAMAFDLSGGASIRRFIRIASRFLWRPFPRPICKRAAHKWNFAKLENEDKKESNGLLLCSKSFVFVCPHYCPSPEQLFCTFKTLKGISRDANFK